MTIRMLCRAVAITILFCTSSPAGLLDGVIAGKKEVGTFDLAGDPAAQAKTYLKPGRLDALRGLKRVAITSFQVEFAVENTASAHSLGVSTKASALLHGPTKDDFQAITDKGYERVAADLQAAGLEIVPFGSIEASTGYQKFKSRQEPVPKLFTTQDGKSLFFSPTNLPLYFRSRDDRLGGGSGIMNSLTVVHPENFEPQIAKELDAAVLRVRAVVDIAKQKTFGGGGFANVKTKAELNMMADFTEYMFITPKGTAVIKLGKHMNFAEQPAGLEKVKQEGGGPMPDLTALGGPNLSGISHSKAAYAITVPPEDYRRLVDAHLKALEAMMVAVIKPAL